MRQQQEALAALVVFVKAAKDAGGDELAERGARPVHILAVGEVSLLLQEVCAVDQQAVH